MTKLEDRVKQVIRDMHKQHSRQIDQQVYSILFLGIMIGIALAYSGLLGFSSGFITGVIISEKFGWEWSRKIIVVSEHVSMYLKNYFKKRD